MSDNADARVCPVCRLIQQPTKTCRACGAGVLVPRSEAFQRLTEVTRAGRQLGWSQVSASLSIERLKFVALGLGALVGVALLVVWAQDQSRTELFWGGIGAVVAGVFADVGCEVFISDRPAAAKFCAVSYAPGAHSRLTSVVLGEAQGLEKSVESHASGERCLAAHLTIGNGTGALYFRGARASDFIIAGEDRTEPTVVSGELWIATSGGMAVEIGVAERSLGVHADYPDPPVADEHLVRPGDQVEAVGIVSSEVVGQLAGYRDSGMTTVLRGTPGRPVVVRCCVAVDEVEA